MLEAELAARDWLGWERRLAPAASEAQLELIHTRGLIDGIRSLCERGGGAIDMDTYVGPRSYEAALHAAGGAVAMTSALLEGEASAGFTGMRPSGHHAESGRAMGFCLFNNVAVAAAWAIAEAGLERVFVLDWDVHHGNGTAEIFGARRDVLFASLHQSPLYPGTGALEDSGDGAGKGFTINLPVPPGTGPELWMALFERVVLAAAREFRPQLILVSCGFDAHRADPLAHCMLEIETFVEMAARIKGLAEEVGAPLGVVMEGGYEPDVLAGSVCAVLPVLAGARTGAAERPVLEEPLLARAAAVYGQWWPIGAVRS